MIPTFSHMLPCDRNTCMIPHPENNWYLGLSTEIEKYENEKYVRSIERTTCGNAVGEANIQGEGGALGAPTSTLSS